MARGGGIAGRARQVGWSSLSQNFHDSVSAARAVGGPSGRAFGLPVGVIVGLLGPWRWWVAGLGLLAALLPVLGMALVLGGILLPAALAPLHRAWTGLGPLLGRIMTPIVMGVVYVLALVPTGLVMRARGRDLLRLRRDRDAPTYWLDRRPPGPAPETMANQF